MNMDFDQHKKQISMIIDYLDEVGGSNELEFIEYKHRQRVQLEMMRYHGVCAITGKKDKQSSYPGKVPDVPHPASTCWGDNEKNETHLVLNEVMASEADASCVSMYRLNVDGRDLGKFKSSGIIIATGTGSRRWLHSAKQITPS
jgi:NAD kinase